MIRNLNKPRTVHRLGTILYLRNDVYHLARELVKQKYALWRGYKQHSASLGFPVRGSANLPSASFLVP